MQYSPKLKKAMSEIQQILKNNDIAGVIVLHTPGHIEYSLNLEPSYSCAILNNEGVRLRATEALHGKTRRDKMITDTTDMILGLAKSTCMNGLNLVELEKLLRKKFDIESSDSHTTHDTQNN